MPPSALLEAGKEKLEALVKRFANRNVVLRDLPPQGRFEPTSESDEEVRFRVAISSEVENKDFFLFEDFRDVVFLHEPGAMREEGRSVLVSHNSFSLDSFVGRLENLEVEKDRILRADMVFPLEDTDAARAATKVKTGILQGVSGRFRIYQSTNVEPGERFTSPGGQEFEAGRQGLVVVTQWGLREASLTPTPADTNVGVKRSDQGETHMDGLLDLLRAAGVGEDQLADGANPEDAKEFLRTALAKKPEPKKPQKPDPATPEPEPTRATPPAPANADDTMRAFERLLEKREGEEAKRAEAVRNLVKSAGLPDTLADQLVASRTTLEEANKKVIEALRAPPVAGIPHVRFSGTAGTDHERDYKRFLARRMGLGEKRDHPAVKRNITYPEGILERSGPQNHMAIVDTLRTMAAFRGVPNAYSLQPEQFLSHPDTQRSLGIHGVTADYANVLANLSNLVIQERYLAAEQTYRLITKAISIPDFKTTGLPALSGVQQYTLIHEGEEVEDTLLGESGEQITLQVYATKASFTIQTMANDSLGAFENLGESFGEAAALTENALVWAHLGLNGGAGPAMQETGDNFFSVRTAPLQTNIFTGAGVVNDTNVQDGVTAMASHVDVRENAASASTRRVGYTPAVAIVPPGLFVGASNYFNPSAVPAGIADDVATGPLRGVQVAMESQLVNTPTTAWTLWASQPGVTIARRSGFENGPQIFRSESPVELGMAWIGVHPFAVRANNYRVGVLFQA